jgi:SAM-dependent methyltransferase
MSTRAPAAFEKSALASLFVDFARLKPNERVLDIGCGFGRWADPLIGYLNEEGGYDGLDVVADRIERCNERIGQHHPNFNFHVIDVFNKHYSPESDTQVEDFRFPFADGEIDVAVLYSVFTHMLPDDVETYFAEIRRLLSDGGRMLASYLLINDETVELLDRLAREPADTHISKNQSFQHDFGLYRATNPDNAEQALAYREDYVVELYERFGFRLTHPIQYGEWRTQEKLPLHQDMVISEKV